MKRCFWGIWLLLAAIDASAVNKCISGGKTTYQDAPCPDGGATLIDIHPETEVEMIRRNHEAAIVSQRLNDAERLRLANERERAQREMQRRAIWRNELRREAAEIRSAQQRSGEGQYRKKYYKFRSKSRTSSLRGLP